MAEDQGELVLLVHGTFGAPEKGKTKWWQIGSSAREELEKRLPKGTRLAERKEIFHWSGQNQERDRYWAGTDLLNRLLRLEREGRPYHLIGHSHGGSVIWHALQEAVRRRIGRKKPDPRLELKHLRSWATVGTPFLQYETSRMGRWPGAVLTKLFLFVSCGLTILLVALLVEHRATIGLQFERLLRLLSVTETETVKWLTIGIFVALCAFAGIAGMALHMWVSAIRHEALAVRQTAFVRNQAMREFGDRWIGLWAREDEAIGGLKGSIRLQVQLLPKFRFLTKRVFVYDRKLWTYKIFLRVFLAPVLNRLVPLGNNLILGTLSRSVQGDDRPGCNVTSISEGPISLRGEYRYPTLPAEVEGALTSAANRHLIAQAPELVPKVRTLLADYSSGMTMVGGGIKAAGFELAGNELIHTLYFDHPAVLDLLAHHVRVHHGTKDDAPRRDDSLLKWYRDTRQDVNENVLEHPVLRKRGLTCLGKGNGLALLTVACGLLALVGLGVGVYWRIDGNDNADIAWLASSGVVVLTLLLGHLAQRRAERGARFRRIASLGVNLGLIGIAIVAIGPITVAINEALAAIEDAWEGSDVPAVVNEQTE